MNNLETAAVEAAINGGTPAKVFHVGPDAAVAYSNGANPFDGMTVTAWDHADIAAGRSE